MVPTVVIGLAPSSNNDERILRRGYSYTDGIDPRTGLLDAGLFFIAPQKDPRRHFGKQLLGG